MTQRCVSLWIVFVNHFWSYFIAGNSLDVSSVGPCYISCFPLHFSFAVEFTEVSSFQIKLKFFTNIEWSLLGFIFLIEGSTTSRIQYEVRTHTLSSNIFREVAFGYQIREIACKGWNSRYRSKSILYHNL